jgi:hypothetical protein
MSSSNQGEKEEKQKKIQPQQQDENKLSTALDGLTSLFKDPNTVFENTSTFSPESTVMELQQQLQQQSKKNTTSTDALSELNTLTILSHNSYIDSIGYMHVIGEIKNNTPNVAQFVQIIATFYDNNNKVVGTSFTYTTPIDLASGEIAPFELILTDASIPIEQIEKYTLKVSGQ